jgi:hypothetical protein
MKYLYKYPQAAYPYADLVETNGGRSRHEMEYELLDTGIFDEDRYFDVFVEYALAGPEDILIRITVANRGPDPATIHVLPHLWFRNTWSWSEGAPRPELKRIAGPADCQVIAAGHPQLGRRFLACEAEPTLLFTENETNHERLFGTRNLTPYVKDGINNFLVHGEAQAVNPERTGTKAAALYQLMVPARGEQVIRLRLTAGQPDAAAFGPEFDATFEVRIGEADELYASITPPALNEDQARVLRQALAGMLWSKQYYYFDVDRWLEEHGADPFLPGGRHVRNIEWFHMVNDHVISMPDKWEYPWYAAWDLAFHTIPLAMVDVDFAKQQLDLMLREPYLHPSGQIPAYEWNFSDVNPPVHPWATFFVYELEKQQTGRGDPDFLKHAFSKLMLNFTWWVNRKDRFGKNVFEGGFLGLDNIGVFDRSAPLPTGGHLEQADGTAWMSMYCQNLAEVAVELAGHDPVYQDMAIKFVEHFLWIAAAMNRKGPDGLWDEEDGFYYDLLRFPDGRSQKLKVRSMVGLLPLCATVVGEESGRQKTPRMTERFRDRIRRMPELLEHIHPTGSGQLMNLFEVAREIGNRLSRIFLRDEQGRRPVYGGTEKFQNDPHWRDYILFYEYFHGDNGAGLGASHQTGWTGMIASVLQMFAALDPKDFLENGRVGPVPMRSRQGD